MAKPRHGKRQSLFVAAFGHEVEIVVSVHRRLGAACVSGVGVEDFSVLVLVKHADSGRFRTGECPQIEVIVHLALGEFLLGERHMIVSVEIVAVRRHPVEAPAHAFLNAAILGYGAREIAANDTSRCARCTSAPSVWSMLNEQLGQPSCQSEPNMKW